MIRNLTYRFLRTAATALAGMAMLCSALTSCDSAIYDNEGDCAIHHRVRFVFDYNMLDADAFAGQVKSVALFAFDPDTHVLVDSWTSNSPDMSNPGWTLDIDVTPGATYDILAWCGIEAAPACFALPQAVAGITTRKQLTCALLQQPQGVVRTDYPLAPMWHGQLDDVTFTDVEGSTQTVTVELTKDTNNILVALQNLSGEPMQEGLFEITITDNNGLLTADNIPFPGTSDVVYHSYHTALGHAAYDPSVFYGDGSKADSRADNDEGSLCVAVAELSTSRLMADSKAILHVRRTDTGATVFRLPLIDLLLMIKGYQNRAMSDQEFLDRQDTYNMTFFLDDHKSWAGAVIMINSWRIVYQPTIFE